jgi:hypothetical protein
MHERNGTTARGPRVKPPDRSTPDTGYYGLDYFVLRVLGNLHGRYTPAYSPPMGCWFTELVVLP